MKFLCDAMLAHVGKRLRTAGYDALIDQGVLRDCELVAISNDEHRFLLTCDRQMQHHRNSQYVVHLASNDERAWAKHLAEHLRVNWTYAPFTRCLECNTVLEATTESVFMARLPQRVRASGQKILHCPKCDQLYWDGTHVARMRAHLQSLQELSLVSSEA